MKRAAIFTSFLVLLTLIAIRASAPVAAAEDNANIAGHWALVTDTGGQSLDISCDLKQTGADFTGSTSSSLGAGTIDSGKVNGKNFTAILHADIQGQQVDFKMEGSVDGDKMTGSFGSQNLGTFSFSGTRTK
ncbi:MAG: hypothetical protein JO053_05540 [Acidobacteria bacterium]|nr:hypothetical protein [Acidobacteriota bacterium]